MTIKKLRTASAAPSAAGAAGDKTAAGASPKVAATIADRFKLDTPDPKALKAATASKRGTQFALTAAIIAFVIAGVLTFVLYKHWEFLMPA